MAEKKTSIIISLNFSQVIKGSRKLDISPQYPNYNGVPGDPVRVFFQCPKFVEERRNLRETLGKMPLPTNIVRGMLVCE